MFMYNKEQMLMCESGHPFTFSYLPLLSPIKHMPTWFTRNAISAINWSIGDDSQMFDHFRRYLYRLNLCGEHGMPHASASTRLELKWGTGTTRNWSRERWWRRRRRGPSWARPCPWSFSTWTRLWIRRRRWAWGREGLSSSRLLWSWQTPAGTRSGSREATEQAS